MSTEKGIEIREEDILSKSSENYISEKIGSLNFFDSNINLDAGLDKLSTTLKSFPSLDASGMEDERCKKKLAYPYEKGKSIESIYKQKLGREEYFSTLKQSHQDFGEIIRTQATVVKNKITKSKELTMLYLKNDVLIITDIFQNYIHICKSAYDIIPLYS